MMSFFDTWSVVDAAAGGALEKAPQSSTGLGAGTAVAGAAEAKASHLSAPAGAAVTGAKAAGATTGATLDANAPNASHAPALAAAPGAEEKSAHPSSPAEEAATSCGASATGAAKSKRSNIPPPAAGAAAGTATRAATAGATTDAAAAAGAAAAAAAAAACPSPGVGPSVFLSAYILRSYLSRMYLSTTGRSETFGLAPAGRFFSQNTLARTFPMRSMTPTCSGVHLSSCVERTREMCTPSPRWIPEQFVHMKMPRLSDAHRGSRMGQSTHTKFSGRFRQRLRRFMSWACSRSPAAILAAIGKRTAELLALVER
mmetsp:Transcript_18348/g.45732  ORF Transcript_18348/g.45732 Transcript_18348/m.45732 type:complete len:314 (+) Transcript_18348:229-1170(+)